MVGACQQNSGIFLVRGGEAGQGLGETPTGRNRVAAGRDGSEQMPGRGRCREVLRLGGLGARCRRRPRLGPGRDADDQITGAGGGKITGAGPGRDAG